MYKLIRNSHLILGLITTLFLMTYGVSALQMSHRIKLHPRVQEEDVTLAPGLNARPLALQLMETRGIEGEIGNVAPNPEGFKFGVTRPGALWTINYVTASGQTHIHSEQRDFLGMLNRLHHLNGVRHESMTLNAWGWAVAFISVVLLTLGGTGVYMWFRLHKERWLGSILLATNLIISLGLIVALRL